MLGIKEYIKFRLGGEPIYNEQRWKASTIDGLNSIVQLQIIPSENVKFIIINQISLSLTNLGNTISFINPAKSNEIIFDVRNNNTTFLVSPFTYFIENTSFKIVANDNSIKWSLSYITVTAHKK